MSATLQDLRPTHGKDLKKNRWPGIIFVLVFHAAAIYALVTGLASSTVQLLAGNLKAVVTQEEVKVDTPPPPPPPDFKPPPVVSIAPEVTLDLAVTPPAATTTISVTPPKAAVAPVVTPPPPPSPATAISSHAVTQDDYPAISIRLVEQGVVKIKYLIGTGGEVSTCEVTMSSGHPRLDDAACAMVKRKWKYKPATQDGKPVSTTQLADVTFRLK
jgi:protein TonB